MPRCLSVLFFCLCSCVLSRAQQSPNDAPIASGVITAASSSGVDLQGFHLRFTPQSLFSTGRRNSGHEVLTNGMPQTFLGEHARAFGKLDHRSNTVTVERLYLTPAAPSQVSGLAVVDLVPPPVANSETRIVRADGYLLVIGPKSDLMFQPPLTPSTPLHANLWIRYGGTQELDGTVLVDSAEFGQNTVNDSEAKLREKSEYDPAAVDPDAHQGSVSILLHGVRPDQLPPWPDTAMQARVDGIGQKLIPTYQRALPDTDPAKLHFRFQVVDLDHLHDAWNLPSGVIVIPHQVVERLENDSQLATVLADNIAWAIEKQTFRALPAKHKLTAVSLAGTAGGLVVPGLGLATGISTAVAAEHLLHEAQRQSGRISLCYLHDAGFDLNEAPKAWWLLASKKPKPLSQINLPFRAEILFTELGTTWRSTVSPSFHDAANPLASN